MIKELTTYIHNNTSLTRDTNLFAGRRPPDAPVACVLVQEVPSGIRNPYPGLTDLGQTPYWIRVRGSSYFSTRDVAMTVFNLLHGKTQVTLPVVESGPSYLVNIACNEPYALGPDEQSNDEFIVTLIVTKQEL